MKRLPSPITRLTAIVTSALLSACVTPPPIVEYPAALAGAGPGGQDMQYLLAHRATASGEAAWPLLVFLHGRGETGGELANVKVHGPIKAAASMAEFPFLIVAPHLPVDAYWEPAAVLAVIDDVVERWPVDSRRIYLTGLSLGGHGTWATAVAAPSRFAAIVPISGRGHPGDACAVKDLPIWAFHGVLDAVVDEAGSRVMADAVRDCGGKPGLTLYPDAGHDAWTRTYDNPKLYTWLLRHTRDAQKSD